MDEVTTAFEWISNNWEQITAVAIALVIFFDRLAKLTPTTKDDGAVSALYRLFAALGLKVKDNPGKKD